MNDIEDDLINLIGEIPEDYINYSKYIVCQLPKKAIGIVDLELEKIQASEDE